MIDLKARLARLGLSQIALGQLVGKGHSAITAWVNTGPPEAVVLLLDCLDALEPATRDRVLRAALMRRASRSGRK